MWQLPSLGSWFTILPSLYHFTVRTHEVIINFWGHVSGSTYIFLTYAKWKWLGVPWLPWPVRATIILCWTNTPIFKIKSNFVIEICIFLHKKSYHGQADIFSQTKDPNFNTNSTYDTETYIFLLKSACHRWSRQCSLGNNPISDGRMGQLSTEHTIDFIQRHAYSCIGVAHSYFHCQITTICIEIWLF